ncbi:MAG: cryptochrome/photolyase family protein [Fimbriiglobus sp.]
MTIAALIFPHQLFADHPAIRGAKRVYLVEHPLFFSQYPFHRQKLLLHRASMQEFARLHPTAVTLECHAIPSTAALVARLTQDKVRVVRYVDPSDDWLSRQLDESLTAAKIQTEVLPDPHFLTPLGEIDDYVKAKPNLFFTDFYIRQRKRLSILIDDKAKPLGGKWSFDAENRKKLPANVRPPKPQYPAETDAIREARAYVRQHFPQALGQDDVFPYATTHTAAKAWLQDFLDHRFADFGDYEDAISQRETTLFHSVLTPMLNIGLISPREVVDAALARAEEVPMNSLEGFIRQVIGWREFIRLVYLKHGRQQRTTNSWGYHKPMPKGFYDGTTGIHPVDHVIRETLRTGYCHHIERLMILGNFLLLCEVHPDAVYQWFMELFVDAYDWVMVPNVYGMSQHADGGLMTTKPYISGSSYVLKMSDFKKGPWCAIWDALYWRFIDQHSEFFAKNPRMSMMVAMKTKLGDKLTEHQKTATAFLKKLHG